MSKRLHGMIVLISSLFKGFNLTITAVEFYKCHAQKLLNLTYYLNINVVVYLNIYVGNKIAMYLGMFVSQSAGGYVLTKSKLEIYLRNN